MGLTGARLNGAELVAAGFATHFVPLEVRYILQLFSYLRVFIGLLNYPLFIDVMLIFSKIHGIRWLILL